MNGVLVVTFLFANRMENRLQSSKIKRMYLIQLLHYKKEDHIKDLLIDDIQGATVEIEQIYIETPNKYPIRLRISF